jgi:HEPN superfamily AbiU2-like protein
VSHGTVVRLRAFVGPPEGPGSGGPMVRRWKRWLEIIRNEIVEMSHKRRVFEVIAEAFETNPALQQNGGTVWLWLAENYASTAAVAVRRQADRSRARPVVSLERLLTEIAANPGALTREWFVRQYVRGRPAMTREDFRERGERDFDGFAGRRAKRVSPRRIRSDRAKLRRAAARLRHYVNKRIAHRALRGYSRAATYGDLNGAIDELGRLLARYWLLLNQGGMVSVEPVIQEDWESALRVPWKT